MGWISSSVDHTLVPFWCLMLFTTLSIVPLTFIRNKVVSGSFGNCALLQFTFLLLFVEVRS